VNLVLKHIGRRSDLTYVYCFSKKCGKNVEKWCAAA